MVLKRHTKAPITLYSNYSVQMCDVDAAHVGMLTLVLA